MHLNEGLLQAYIDNEVSTIQKKIIEEHLKECNECREKLEELKEIDMVIKDAFVINDSLIEINYAKTEEAWKDFNIKLQKTKWKGMKKKMKKYQKLLSGVAVGFIFLSCLFVSPIRQAAADFLHIFRVQKVESIQLSIEDINEMRDAFTNKIGEIDLQQLGKAEVISNGKHESLTLAQAQDKATFPLKFPANANLDDKVDFSGPFVIQFRLDIDEINKILKQLGSQKLIPETLNEKTFTISNQGQVGLQLESLKEISADNVNMVVDGKSIPTNEVKMKATDYQDISFYQMASPEFIVPVGVDAEDLREIFLQIPIIPYGCRDISLSVSEGRIFGFLGPNGAGKSTFVKTLLGLLKPESGNAWLLGKPLEDIKIRKNIGYLPELFRYHAWLTGEDLLKFHAELLGMKKYEYMLPIANVLELVGLLGKEKQKVGSYSKGMQQRIGWLLPSLMIQL